MATNLSRCIPARFQMTRGLMRWTMKPVSWHRVTPATALPVRMAGEERKRKVRLRTELERPRWTKSRLPGFQVLNKKVCRLSVINLGLNFLTV